MKKRALVSVSDKTGVVEFVKGLLEQGLKLFQQVVRRKVIRRKRFTSNWYF